MEPIIEEVFEIGAFEYLKFLRDKSMHPWAIGKPMGVPSNSDIRRWLESGSVIINEKKPGWKDTIEIPVKQVVLFPSGKNRTTVY